MDQIAEQNCTAKDEDTEDPAMWKGNSMSRHCMWGCRIDEGRLAVQREKVSENDWQIPNQTRVKDGAADCAASWALHMQVPPPPLRYSRDDKSLAQQL
jgi:hypothetical protein